MHILDVLKERGFIAQTTFEDELYKQLEEPTTFYVGFDPTADSLHIGIYGFVIAIVIMAKIGIMGGSGAVVPVDKALMMLAAALPIALVGYFSAIAQGKCAAGSMLMVGRRPEMQGKGMMMTAMVETYAVLALLISFLCVNAIVL